MICTTLRLWAWYLPPWAQSLCCRGQSYTFITAAPLGTQQCTQAGNRKVHIHHFHLQGTRIKHRHENHQVSRRKAWVWPPVCIKRPHKSGGAQPMQLFPRGMGALRSHLPSWWLLAQLPAINSPTVLYFPSSSISLPPHPSWLSFLQPVCLPFLLPAPPPIPCPCLPPCLHFPD